MADAISDRDYMRDLGTTNDAQAEERFEKRKTDLETKQKAE